MNSFVYLSYPLSEQTPLYGNGKGISFKSDQQQGKGDSCNTMLWSFPNHSGTHVDSPKHFNLNGKSITDYPPEFWIFNKIELVDISDVVMGSQLIEPEIFPEFKEKNPELLLIKTGYGKYRGSPKYTLTPPGVSARVADWVRTNYASIRCVGMDLISVSSYANRTAGREAHVGFLKDHEPILLVEDLDLSKTNSQTVFRQIIISPLMVEGADGSPCNIIATINNP